MFASSMFPIFSATGLNMRQNYVWDEEPRGGGGGDDPGFLSIF